MDPNILKFFEEDEDETMIPKADMDSLAAEFYRYLEGNNSTPQQPSDSSAAALSPQWQTSGHGGIANSELELQRHPINTQVLEHKARLDNINKAQNISHHSSITVGSNDQQPMLMEFNHQQNSPIDKGNQKISMGVSNEQVLLPLNQHTTGMEMTCQQTMTSRISNPQPMTSTTQQAVTTLKLNKLVSIRALIDTIHPQLDKDKAMQLATLLSNLKKNEISKDDILGNLRGIVGDQMIQMAATQLQIRAPSNSQTATNQCQSQPQTSGRKMQVPSGGENPFLSHPPKNLLQKPPILLTNHIIQNLVAQLPTYVINSMGDNDVAKLHEAEMQEVSHGAQVVQMSTSSSGVLCHEWKHPASPTQGFNRQQNVQFSQTTTSAASSGAIRPPPYDSQMRHHSLIDPKKIPAGSLTRMHSNTALQQNEFQCSSSTSKENKTSISPSMIHVKQKPCVQPNEQKNSQISSSHGISFSPTAPNKLGSVSTWKMKDGLLEIDSSRAGLTPPTTLVPSSSVPSSRPSLMETNILPSSRTPTLTAPRPPKNSKTPPERPLAGQKKSMEAPGSSPPSSKKQKVSGSFVDQSIEHLNDVTAVSGVNISEEEELLFSGSKEDSRVSEVFRRVVQEEEERLMLQKLPLQKVMVEKMAKYGLKSMSNDMEQCLSLCVEERMRGIISNVIRISKQRVNMEKSSHKTIITSDVRKHIIAINRKAREEWEKEQGEAQKLQKLNEHESSTGTDVHKEKDERSLRKSRKLNKKDDDETCTRAANVAIQAATGVADITSRWHLMIEAKKKQGGFDSSSSPRTLTTSTRNRMQNQESERQDPSFSLTFPASVRKVGRMAPSISVKDVIAVLEREHQMSKSMVLYGLYQKVKGDIVSE